MQFHVERERLRKKISLRLLAHLLRLRQHRLTKNGLLDRARGAVPYRMTELVDIAQILGVPVETLYELEPHELPRLEPEEAITCPAP